MSFNTDSLGGVSVQYYYGVLGLPVTATAEEVKKAYRRMAKQHHPDIVGNSPEAVRRFQEIGQAYEYLMAAFNRPPSYPINYYNPYAPQYPHRPPPPPPQDVGFQSYTWESVKEEPSQKRPPKQQKKQAPPPEPPPEPEKPFVSVISKELLLASRLESSQEAIRRILEEKGDEKEQLAWEINLFLKEDYVVETNGGFGNFTVTSNKSGHKVSVRSAQTKQGGSFFASKLLKNPRR